MIARLLAALFLLTVSCVSGAQEERLVALVGGTVHSSPGAAPLRDAVVLTSHGTITAVARRNEISIPAAARVIDCTGRTVVAGFWNSHVHFTGPQWNQAASAPADALEKHTQEMLTRWGFTTVWDLGSDPQNSLALRRRIDAGEIKGPRLLLTGNLFPLHGHPVYLPADWVLPEAATPEKAAEMTRGYLSQHLDGIKLFTGVFVANAPVMNMSVSIVKAAADVAHSQRKPVFAHPQNRAGLDNALKGGVDVLAHTIPDLSFHYSAEELNLFRTQHTALVPTLSLWADETSDSSASAQFVAAAIGQVRAFASNGGPILFGTDVGYTSLYDTTRELDLMQRALSPGDVLASLTTAPAAYFKAAKKGRVERGFDADLVVLDGDLSDARNLAKVRYTIRGGRIIYEAGAAESGSTVSRVQ